MTMTLVCEICKKVLKNKKARSGHMWFAHHIRVGPRWNLENEIKQLRDKLIIHSKCCKCGKPVAWDLSRDTHRVVLIETLDAVGKIMHPDGKCPVK